MKTKFFLLPLLVALASSFTLNTASSDDLLGKWKVDESSLDKTTKAVINVTRKTNPSRAEQMDASFEMVKQVVANIVVEYKADHSYEVQTPQGPQIGKWELQDNGHTLLISPTGKPSRKDSILEISATQLRLINRERGDTTLFIHP